MWRIDFKKKKWLNFHVCVVQCIMTFRWIYKQPGMQKFEINAVIIKKSMTEYHHLKDNQASLPFILTQQSMGEMSMGNLVTCLFLMF